MTIVLGKVIRAGAVRAIRVSFNHSLLGVLEEKSIMLVKNDRSKSLKPVQVSEKPLDIQIIGQLFLPLFEVQLL